MGKQKSIAQLKNMQKKFAAQLENMTPADKTYRAVKAKLQAAERQLNIAAAEADGVL